MYPHFILSDNGTEFKNQLMDNILKQLGIDSIFSALYHQQSNGKLDVFHKYLNQLLISCVKMVQTTGTDTSSISQLPRETTP